MTNAAMERREQIARIIAPTAFHDDMPLSAKISSNLSAQMARAHAFSKADAILALETRSAAHLAGWRGGVERAARLIEGFNDPERLYPSQLVTIAVHHNHIIRAIRALPNPEPVVDEGGEAA